MTEAKKHTEREIETLFLAQWEAKIGQGRGGAIAAFHRMRNWVGPQLWKVLLEMELTQPEWNHIINALPAGMVKGMSGKAFITDLLVIGARQFSDLKDDVYLVPEPPSLKPTVKGNVVHLPFGRTHEKTDNPNM
jgi:hypothetical protein